ncbi:glycoside hydrolase family 3 N-terminal domain-containing protein [Bacteroides helcogenes]|uniref:beta-N-acetylhexosaminidase n=1 Tax=Bacteroides helcogenes (strain ATCC 35417 / DSM 20613 / JCM 6297 / CCUG 15421 / P 36-108) TaxID=693979 RepID=E6STS1_BACT6|nr:glycoside hydrolase family 3 N-terminal domain-containing protein [Bacteroides helcogenes]ADV42274.1 glycoside hydrolase family 3 domain protein [Bacteroides helcogenes P 36-108]MDY5237272.1 glycoside hydrolase family 3 N-terminal domain-containing protein [Bacteroides helcogenes]
MKRIFLFASILLFCCGHMALDARHIPVPPAPVPAAEPSLVHALQDDARCRQWVDSVLKRLTLEERIGQLFIYTIAPHPNKATRKLLRTVVEDYKVGGLLFSGGLMSNQAVLTNEAQRMANVPLMITFDGEWGLSMRLRGTPGFPRNMVLGCIRNDSLIYEYGREMARQCHELGIQVNFAPVADVNINPQNPVINTRSFGENPVNVAKKVIAYSKGLEDGGVLSVCKHFPGHGDTDVDSHKALPTLPFTRERLDSVELYPFKEAIRAGLGGIMVGHLEVPVFEVHGGLPSSLSRSVVYDLLTRELKFQGLIFTDALAMKGVSDNSTVCLQALKAGNDLLLVPRRIKEEVEAILDAVKRRELKESDIEEKCRKVLMYKYALGLTRKPFIHISGLGTRINTPRTRELIQRLNLAAITVLGNQDKVLPLDPAIKEVAVLNVGDSREIRPFMKELSQFTCPAEFQLEKNPGEQSCRYLQDTLAQYKRVLVCITEHRLAPYQTFFATFAPDVPVTYLCFIPGKQTLQIHRGISAGKAMVLAHSSDDDVQRQVAKILYGKAVADGRLSADIGGLFAAGTGVTLGPNSTPHFIPEEYGMNSRILAQIDGIVEEGLRAGAYADCAVAVLKDGREMYNKAFGTHTGDVYDLASLTKTTATLLAVMKLYDKGRLSLTDRVSDYLPFLQDTDKKNITVRELLLHESGLPSTLLFYQDAIDKGSYSGSLFKGKADKAHPVRVGSQTWGNSKFRFRKGLTSNLRTAECTLQVSDSLWLNRSFKHEYLRKIAETPLKDKRYRYSCVGFIVLQQLVEARAGMPMDEFLAKEFYIPMGLKRTGFLPLRFLKKEDIIPSSIDSFLRKTTLQGFVHDEAAAFQGGVSGNAGLFSTAGEVSRIYQMILNDGELDGKRYLSKETCKLFTTTVSRISRRGLGFDKPDARNPQKSPCAISAPASVYGHTGFTGTCAWVDPDNGLVYVFLSNRIYPNVWNNKLMSLDIRKRIQETIYKAMESGK